MTSSAISIETPVIGNKRLWHVLVWTMVVLCLLTLPAWSQSVDEKRSPSGDEKWSQPGDEKSSQSPDGQWSQSVDGNKIPDDVLLNRARIKEPASPRIQTPAPAPETPQYPERLRPGAVRPSQPSLMNEFQEFVAGSIGKPLPIYGYSLFTDVPTTFAPVDRIPVTAEYVIGPGDELLVRVWGQIDLNVRTVVDRTGNIYVPKVGNVTVAGLKYEQLQEYLKTAIGRVFRNFDLSANLGQLRSIQVFVVGQAARPGAYTVSSLSTLVNTVFASGGPSPNGSMRHIQLKRANKVVTEFDMYDLLIKGDKSKDAVLLPGDVIYIPPIGNLVAVAGSVNVPAIYELDGETSLADVVELAGGFTTTAAGQKAIVERIDNRTVRKIEEFPLDRVGLRRELRDGDVVKVFALSPRFENAVTIRGNVDMPGRFPWHPGMRVRDLIPNREMLITRDYWRAQNGVGGNPAAILRSKVPEINWEYASIQRINPDNLTTRLVPFNLRKAVLEGDEENNLALEPGDVITIFSQADLKVPVRNQSKYVWLEGEFKAAGLYRVEGEETLRGLVERAGGLTGNAYLFGAQFTRESSRIEQQKALDDLTRQLDKELEKVTSTAALEKTSAEMATAEQQFLPQRRTLEKLKEVKASGRVVLDLRPEDKSVANLPDIVLEDGDRFYVPYRALSVNVVGETYKAGTFIYSSRRRLKDYLQMAGGPTRYADRGHIFVVRADGSVISRGNMGDFWSHGVENLKLMPGDTIAVPEAIKTTTFTKEFKDWAQIISQFGLGAAAIKVLAP